VKDSTNLLPIKSPGRQRVWTIIDKQQHHQTTDDRQS
jgi:hypothetical protein